MAPHILHPRALTLPPEAVARLEAFFDTLEPGTRIHTRINPDSKTIFGDVVVLVDRYSRLIVTALGHFIPLVELENRIVRTEGQAEMIKISGSVLMEIAATYPSLNLPVHVDDRDQFTIYFSPESNPALTANESTIHLG